MRSLGFLFMSAALAGCTMAPPRPQPSSPAAMARLNSLLAGKMAGQPRTCLPGNVRSNMQIIDQNTIIFRDGSRIWRTDLPGGCQLLGRHLTLVTVGPASETMCSGRPFQMADTSSGMIVGSCVWGDFVPFNTPRR